jgi:hypothetical protein
VTTTVVVTLTGPDGSATLSRATLVDGIATSLPPGGATVPTLPTLPSTSLPPGAVLPTTRQPPS